jgi:hypothetical protein
MTESNPYSPPLNHEIDSGMSAILTEAMRFTFWPAVLMIAQGVILSGVFVFAMCFEIYERGINSLVSNENLVYFLTFLAPLLVVCGMKLKRIESKSFSYLGAVISVFLFLPLGWAICIWAVVALNRPVVREAFRIRTLTQ